MADTSMTTREPANPGACACGNPAIARARYGTPLCKDCYALMQVECPAVLNPALPRIYPGWCEGLPWYDRNRGDCAASQALEWACPTVTLAAPWLTPELRARFDTNAPVCQYQGRAVSPSRFMVLLRSAYAEKRENTLRDLARQVNADGERIVRELREHNEQGKESRDAREPALKRLAVLCGAALYLYSYADLRKAEGELRPLAALPIAPDTGLGELAHLAELHNINALWLLPAGAAISSPENSLTVREWAKQTPEALEARYPAYHWQPLSGKATSTSALLAGYKCWQGENREGVLWFYAAWLAWQLIGNLAELPAEAEARASTLAGAVVLAGALLDTRLAISPSLTGYNLIKRHMHHFKLSEDMLRPLPAEIAAIITEHLPSSIMWRREPTEAEGDHQGGRVRLWRYDRNWSFISSARRAPVGEPTYTREYVPGVPGLYRLRSASAPARWPQQAPGLFMVGAGIGEYPREIADTWAWEPQIRLALAEGWQVDIAEGYYWPREQTHELFRTWQGDMWAGVQEARRLQTARPDLALSASMAEHAIKHIGRAAIGRLKMTPGVKVISRAEAEAAGLKILRAKVDRLGKETGLVEVEGSLPPGAINQPQWWAYIIASANERLQAAMCRYALEDTVHLYVDALVTLREHAELAGSPDKVGGFRYIGQGWAELAGFNQDAVGVSRTVKAAMAEGADNGR